MNPVPVNPAPVNPAPVNPCPVNPGPANPASEAVPDLDQVAAGLRLSIGLLLHRLRQAPVVGDLTLGEIAVLVRLDRGGPATPSALARQEQISPQSIGATVAALEARGLVERHPDPQDGRLAVLSLTEAGLAELRQRRDARTQHLARALASGFSPGEVAHLQAAAPLLERLAEHL